MVKKQVKLSKSDFIEFLSQASKNELNNMIKEKGKEPKLVNVIYRIDNNK